MKLFRKKTIDANTTGNPKTDAVAWLIFSGCMQLQLKWAGAMERLVQRLPKYGRVTVFLLAATCSMCASAYLVISSLRRTAVPKLSFSHASLQPGRREEHRQAVAIVTPRDLDRLNRFTRYMDSLARSPSGKAAYDSIMRARPGLLDSARNTIQLYQPQLK